MRNAVPPCQPLILAGLRPAASPPRPPCPVGQARLCPMVAERDVGGGQPVCLRPLPASAAGGKGNLFYSPSVPGPGHGLRGGAREPKSKWRQLHFRCSGAVHPAFNRWTRPTAYGAGDEENRFQLRCQRLWGQGAPFLSTPGRPGRLWRGPGTLDFGRDAEGARRHQRLGGRPDEANAFRRPLDPRCGWSCQRLYFNPWTFEAEHPRSALHPAGGRRGVPRVQVASLPTPNWLPAVERLPGPP